MEGTRGRKRSRGSPTTNDAPVLEGSVPQSTPTLSKQRRESNSIKTSRRKSVDSLLTDIASAISGDNGASVKMQVLEALGVRRCDASTQTERRSSLQGPTGCPEPSFHVPAVGAISSLRRRKRSRSFDSPVKRLSRSSSKDHKSPEAKPSRIGREPHPDEIECALCLRPASEFQQGPLYGPYRYTSKQSLTQPFSHGGQGSKCAASKKVFSFDLDDLCWVHSNCAAWTPGVIVRGTSLEGLSSAIYKGRTTVSGVYIYMLNCGNTYSAWREPHHNGADVLCTLSNPLVCIWSYVLWCHSYSACTCTKYTGRSFYGK